jgi:hypothetical protein
LTDKPGRSYPTFPRENKVRVLRPYVRFTEPPGIEEAKRQVELSQAVIKAGEEYIDFVQEFEKGFTEILQRIKELYGIEEK